MKKTYYTKPYWVQCIWRDSPSKCKAGLIFCFFHKVFIALFLRSNRRLGFIFEMLGNKIKLDLGETGHID